MNNKNLIPNSIIQRLFIKFSSFDEQKRFFEYLDMCPTSGPATAYASKILETKLNLISDFLIHFIGIDKFNKLIK
jgi:hypothetical protein